jgi:DNA-binding SARP family transcriptional activator
MQFQILGPLRVTNRDEREIAIGGAKPSALLALLLLRANEVIAPDRLIEDLWDGRPPATAAKTLQVHISRLRRALGEGGNGAGAAIATSRGGYTLQVEPELIDALWFEALISAGQAALAAGAHARASARLRAGLALWRGEALADFAYASFAQDAIARLDGLRTVAVEAAVEAELALGRHAELVPELKALVKRDPLSEHLRGQLMLALYRAGRQAEALGVYRAGRRVLVDQLGLEPSAELRELERAILAQDDQLAAPSLRSRPQREQAEKSGRGPFVGYERELRALEEVLEEALVGHVRVALISGEPGIGKTRLADELSSVARARGARVVWGRCLSGGGAPVYWPWVQVLRTLLADRDPVTIRAEVGSGAAELAQLLPELSDLAPDANVVDPGDAGDARFRLLVAVASFVGRAAAAQPLVIVLDDLQAADPSTLSLLELIAAGALDAPVLIVGTYRDTEAALERNLNDTLNVLARASDCLQLVLTGLSAEDTAHFVEVSAGVAPMPALAGAVHDASTGNPLFVSELVRLLRAEDRLHELTDGGKLVLPRGIDQVIARRLEHVSDACRRTLSLAAVIGRDFDVALLERAGAVGGQELLNQVEDGLAARVVEEAGAQFRFTHELVRHALYQELSVAERARMHAEVATALETLHVPPPASVVADLAHHFSEALPAGDPAKAVAYLELAGDHASELLAKTEAASYYERAAAVAASRAGDPEAACELQLKLAEQLVLTGDLHRAKQAVEAVEASGGVPGDPAREGRLAIARAHLALIDPFAYGADKVFDAIALFQGMDDPYGEARAWYALLALNCGNFPNIDHGEPAARMLECARRTGSRTILSQALRAVSSSSAVGPMPVSQAIPRLRGLLETAPDDNTRARLHIGLAMLAGAHGRFEEARATLATAWALAPRHEQANLRSVVLSYGARLELRAGNMQRAEEMARELCAVYRSDGLIGFLSSELCYLIDALIGQGRLDEVEADLEYAASITPPDDEDAHHRQARSRARLALAHGDFESASTWARRALEYVDGGNTPEERAESLLVLARALLAAGDTAGGREAAAEALRLCERRESVVLAQQARDLLEAGEHTVAGAPAVAT